LGRAGSFKEIFAIFLKKSHLFFQVLDTFGWVSEVMHGVLSNYSQ